jgi:hypothetical protein
VAEGRLSADDRYSVAALASYVTFTHACFALFSLEKCFSLIPSLGFTGWTSLMPLARGYGSYWQGRGEIKAFRALRKSAVQALVWCQNSCIPGMLAKSSFKGRRVPDESSIARGWYGPTSPHASRPDITWPHSEPSAHPRARLYNSEESSNSRHLHQYAELLGSLATRSWLHEVGRAVDASFLHTGYSIQSGVMYCGCLRSCRTQRQACGSSEQRRQRTPALLANSTFGVLYSLRPFTSVLPEPWHRFHIA